MAASLIEFLACLRTNFELFCLIFGISKSRKFYFSYILSNGGDKNKWFLLQTSPFKAMSFFFSGCPRAG